MSAIVLLVIAGTGIFSTVLANNPTGEAHYLRYIIVGGGPLFLVIAERLPRNGLEHVVLLEAGPETFNLLCSKVSHRQVYPKTAYQCNSAPAHLPSIAQAV